MAMRFAEGAALTSMMHRLFVPSRQPVGARGAPLLVALHGSMQTPNDFAAGTDFDRIAERVGAYVLYPGQSRSTNRLRSWNWFREEQQSRSGGEPTQILDLVAAVCERYRIDRRRVFVAGLSAGGAMAAVLAEQAPDVFAAAGIMAGLPLHRAHNLRSAIRLMRGRSAAYDRPLMPRPALSPSAYRDLRVTIWTGARDRVVAPENSSLLADQFRCLLSLNEDNNVAEHDVAGVVRRWYDERGTIRLEYRRIRGLGHPWSGGSPKGSYTFPAGPNASEEMMSFFLERRDVHSLTSGATALIRRAG